MYVYLYRQRQGLIALHENHGENHPLSLKKEADWFTCGSLVYRKVIPRGFARLTSQHQLMSMGNESRKAIKNAIR